jgi:hypothetical protein
VSSKITLGKSHELPVHGKITEKSWEIPYGWSFFAGNIIYELFLFPLPWLITQQQNRLGLSKNGGAKSG